MIFLKSLTFLIAFLIPLFGTRNNLGYEQIKVFIFITSLTVCGILWTIYSIKHPFKIIWSGINKAAILFICILFLTSTLGIDVFNSFVGTQPYFQGFIFYAYLYLFFLLVSLLKVKINHWAYILVGSSSLVSLLAIKDWVLLNLFGQIIPSYAGRVVSTFGQPNFYAGFLLLTLPFIYLLFNALNEKRRYIWFSSGLIVLTGIFVSYSRLAILMALVLLILGLIEKLKVRFKMTAGVFLVILGSILLALKFSSGIVGSEISRPILTKNPDLTRESVEKRVYIWPQALKIALQKPFTGYGLENIDKAFINYFTDNKHLLFEENLQISPVLISLKELNIDRSHNYFLDLLLFSGVAGLSSFLFLVFLLFKKLKQEKGLQKNVLLVALITYLVWIQFQNQSVVHLIYFWLLVGIIDSKIKTSH